MNNLVILSTMIVEQIAIFVCIYALFGEKFRTNIYFGGIVIFNSFVMIMETYGNWPRSMMITVYVVSWIYFWRVLKKKWWQSLLCYLLGIMICGFCEGILFLGNYFIQDYVDSYILSFAYSIFLLAISVLFNLKFSVKARERQLYRNRRILLLSLVGMIIQIPIFMEYAMSNSSIRVSLMFVVIYAFIIYFIAMYVLKINSELQLREAEGKMSEIYGRLYENEVANFRVKQHDFKNQINALYGIQYSAKSYEELVELQRSYSETLLQNTRHSSILTRCVNPILSGFLYQKINVIEKESVLVDFDINVCEMYNKFPINEQVEALGIMLDNAYEAVGENEHKLIKCFLREEKNSFIFRIENQSEFIKSEKINKIFEKGFSTKGSGRGIGLFRLKEISKKNELDILVENNNIEGVNWISFGLVDKVIG